MNAIDENVSQHERALIAGLVSGRVRFDHVSDVVCSEDFTPGDLGLVFDALRDIAKSGVPLVLSAIQSELKARDHRGRNLLDLIGGEYSLKNLTDEGRVTWQAAEYHASQVAEAGRRRRMRAVLMEALERSELPNESITAITSMVTAELTNLEPARKDDFYTAGDAALIAFGEIHEAWQSDSQVGLRTGIRDLDEHLGGMRPGTNIVLAARPSIGKSCVGAEIAQRVAAAGGRVLFANLEMSQSEMGQRFLSRLSGIPSNLLSRPSELNEFNLTTLARCQQQIAQWPLTLWGGSGRSIEQLASAAKRFHARSPLSLLVIDYLGLLNGSGKDRYQAVSDVSQKIKALAMDLKVPVLTLCQLNRESEKHGRDPNLSDLRDSGAIEQDADIVIFIVRDRDSEDCRLKIAKFRNGPLGEVLVRFEGAYSRVMDHSAAGVAWRT